MQGHAIILQARCVASAQVRGLGINLQPCFQNPGPITCPTYKFKVSLRHRVMKI